MDRRTFFKRAGAPVVAIAALPALKVTGLDAAPATTDVITDLREDEVQPTLGLPDLRGTDAVIEFYNGSKLIFQRTVRCECRQVNEDQFALFAKEDLKVENQTGIIVPLTKAVGRVPLFPGPSWVIKEVEEFALADGDTLTLTWKDKPVVTLS